MEKKHTIAHFFTAIVFVIFAIALLKISSGAATTDRFKNDYGPVLALYIPFLLCIVGLAGIITVLQEGEFLDWLKSVGVIALIGLAGFIFDGMQWAAALVGGLYAVYWTIVALRSLANNWDAYEWENKLLALARVLIAAALVLAVVVWVQLPVERDVTQDMSSVTTICGWAGGVAIAAAVCVFIEGVLWIKYADY